LGNQSLEQELVKEEMEEQRKIIKDEILKELDLEAYIKKHMVIE